MKVVGGCMLLLLIAACRNVQSLPTWWYLGVLWSRQAEWSVEQHASSRPITPATGRQSQMIGNGLLALANKLLILQGGPKNGTFLCALTYQILTNFLSHFTVRIRRKFVIILSLKIPPHLKCVATLPCECQCWVADNTLWSHIAGDALTPRSSRMGFSLWALLGFNL